MTSTPVNTIVLDSMFDFISPYFDIISNLYTDLFNNIPDSAILPEHLQQEGFLNPYLLSYVSPSYCLCPILNAALTYSFINFYLSCH
jgi:hypothetical protein